MPRDSLASLRRAAVVLLGGAADPAGPVATSGIDHPARTWRIWGVDFDARIVQTITACMLILMVAYNNKFVQMEYDHFALEAVIPLAIVVLFWRESPRRYGLILGNWKLGLVVAGAFIAVMAVVIWVLGHTPEFSSYYALLTGGRSAGRLIIDTGIDMFAWEFFFRGWLLWSLGRKYGTDAIWLQMIPFALMHVWKPELELLSTIAGGVFFGILAWRTRSFIWGWLLHWFMVSWILLVAGGYV